MDDRRAGWLIRRIRQHLRLRQIDVAAASGVSQQEISLIELGRLEQASLRTLRSVLDALGGTIEIQVRWRGGDLDRIADEGHALLVATTAEALRSSGWTIVPEVSYSVYGERGSIDLVAWHPDTRTLLVVEVKTELTSVEATLRKHDEKVRLADAWSRSASDGSRGRSVGCSSCQTSAPPGAASSGTRPSSGTRIQSAEPASGGGCGTRPGPSAGWHSCQPPAGLVVTDGPWPRRGSGSRGRARAPASEGAPKPLQRRPRRYHHWGW